MKTKRSFSGSGCFSSDAGNLPRGEAVNFGFEKLFISIYSLVPLRWNWRTGTDLCFLVPCLVEYIADSSFFFSWVAFLMISFSLLVVGRWKVLVWGEVSLGDKEGNVEVRWIHWRISKKVFLRALLVFFTKKYVCYLYDEMKSNLWSKACNCFPRPSDDDSLDKNDDYDHNDSLMKNNK